MHTRSLLVPWDSPFTTDCWFIVLGTSAKELMCWIWKFPACQGAFPCSFQRYMGVGASNLQKMPAPSCHSVSFSLSPSHLLSQESISIYVVFPFLCMKPQLLFVLWFSAGHCVMLVTRDTSLGAGFEMLNTLDEHWLKTSLLLLSMIQRIFTYFHLIFQYCSGHTRGKASFHHPQAKI